MRIINQSKAIVTINGSKIFPGDEFITSENMFNTQPIYSDIGSVEIVTEYGKRIFHNYGDLTAYEDNTRKDCYELPFIIIKDTDAQCFMDNMTQELINQIKTNIGCCQYHLSCPDCGETWWDNDAFPKRCPKCGKDRWNS